MKNMNKIQSPLARFVRVTNIKKDEISNIKSNKFLLVLSSYSLW